MFAYGEIQAKPTWFKGVRFDSRLEAKWACFLHYLSVRWRREPNKYKVPGIGTGYLPDLLLFDVGPVGQHRHVHVELRPEGRPNEKAAAFSTEAPILLFYGAPIDNEPMELHYKGQSCCVRFNGAGRLVSCATDARPIGADTDLGVLRAYFQSEAYEYEAHSKSVETALLGVASKAIGRLSRPALVVLHLINSCLPAPASRDEISAAAADQGLSLLDTELAVSELMAAGMLSDSERRRTFLRSLQLS